MAERTVTVESSHGLHARPAKLFVQAVQEKKIPVTIAVEGGPETMYPEYQEKLKAELAKMPPPATQKPAAPAGGAR